MLWQFEDQHSGDMVTLDLAASWIDAGWNVGVFDWGLSPMNHFFSMPKRKYGRRKVVQVCAGGMRQGTITRQRDPAVSAGELFYESYVQALADFSGPEMRPADHSLG